MFVLGKFKGDTEPQSFLQLSKRPLSIQCLNVENECASGIHLVCITFHFEEALITLSQFDIFRRKLTEEDK